MHACAQCPTIGTEILEASFIGGTLYEKRENAVPQKPFRKLERNRCSDNRKRKPPRQKVIPETGKADLCWDHAAKDCSRSPYIGRRPRNSTNPTAGGDYQTILFCYSSLSKVPCARPGGVNLYLFQFRLGTGGRGGMGRGHA